MKPKAIERTQGMPSVNQQWAGAKAAKSKRRAELLIVACLTALTFWAGCMSERDRHRRHQEDPILQTEHNEKSRQ